LDEIAREGARRMLAAALRAEADAYVDALVEQVDEDGHRLVVRNGHHDPRTMTMTMTVGAVGSGRRGSTTSGLMRSAVSVSGSPRWSCRHGVARSPKISEVLPLLHLHGLCGGDFVPALEQFSARARGFRPR